MKLVFALVTAQGVMCIEPGGSRQRQLSVARNGVSGPRKPVTVTETATEVRAATGLVVAAFWCLSAAGTTGLFVWIASLLEACPGGYGLYPQIHPACAFKPRHIAPLVTIMIKLSASTLASTSASPPASPSPF